MIPLGSVTNFGLCKLVANNFSNAKAYSNGEFAALKETTMFKITAIETIQNFCNFSVFIKTAKNTIQNV